MEPTSPLKTSIAGRLRGAYLKVRSIPVDRLFLYGIILLVSLIIGSYLYDGVRQDIRNWREDRTDSRQSANINKAINAADTHESNANAIDAAVQENNRRAAEAHTRREAARRTTSATSKPLETAIEKNANLSNRSVDDTTPIADADICSELAKRGLNCR